GRTDVRAMRIAEEHEERPSFDIRVGDRIAVLVDQPERTGDGGGCRPGADKVPGSIKEHSGENDQPGHKCGKDQKNLRRSRGHGIISLIRSTRPSRRAPSRKTPQYRNKPTVQLSVPLPTGPRPRARPAKSGGTTCQQN